MRLYFDATSGISGDMAVGALLDLNKNEEKLRNVLKSINLDDEFDIKISKRTVNAIIATDFDVILKERDNKHHHHRNLDDIYKILDKADTDTKAISHAKKYSKSLQKLKQKCTIKK